MAILSVFFYRRKGLWTLVPYYLTYIYNLSFKYIKKGTKYSNIVFGGLGSAKSNSNNGCQKFWKLILQRKTKHLDGQKKTLQSIGKIFIIFYTLNYYLVKNFECDTVAKIY